MKKLVFVIGLLVLVGCTGVHKVRYGNYLEKQVAVDKMVADISEQMIDLYPPANTTLFYLHKDRDFFGKKLTTELRQAGFKVCVFDNQEEKKEKTFTKKDVLERSRELDFGYIIDREKEGSIIRITLKVGNNSLSRGYDAETFKPISLWTKGA